MDHWRLFVGKLEKTSWVRQIPKTPKGHIYYIRHKKHVFKRQNAFIIGDAAGLSTLDMGEGIHAAIASGIQAANAISAGQQYFPVQIPRFSLPGILFQR